MIHIEVGQIRVTGKATAQDAEGFKPSGAGAVWKHDIVRDLEGHAYPLQMRHGHEPELRLKLLVGQRVHIDGEVWQDGGDREEREKKEVKEVVLHVLLVFTLQCDQRHQRVNGALPLSPWHDSTPEQTSLC